MNIVILQGIVGRKPVRETIGAVRNILCFPLGTIEKINNTRKQRREDVRQWHRIRLYHFPESLADELTPGTEITVEGRLIQRTRNANGDIETEVAVAQESGSLIFDNNPYGLARNEIPKTSEADADPGFDDDTWLEREGMAAQS